MATIKKRKDKFVVIYDYITQNGERKQKWETYETKTAAEKRVKQIEYDKSRDNFIAPNDQTVAEFLAEWAPLQAKQRWQYKTYMGNMQMIEQHINPSIGRIVLQRLTSKQVETMFAQLRTKKVAGGFTVFHVPSETGRYEIGIDYQKA